MKEIALVALGGAVGSAFRYKISVWSLGFWQLAAFPLGTFLVNLIGCFAIGIFSGLAERYELTDPRLKLLLVSGFLGGFTTFSAFSVEVAELMRSGALKIAITYVLTSVLLGILLVFVGKGLAS